MRLPECPNIESIGFCLLCPFFGPAFYSVGVCTRPRFLVSLALWIIVVSSIAALLTRYQATHQLSLPASPASQLHINKRAANSPLWCSGASLQLSSAPTIKDPSLRLFFQAFPSATTPPIDTQQRLVYNLSRIISSDGASAGQPIWEFVLPLTPSSSMNISLTPLGATDNSSTTNPFRLTVLRNSANKTCLQNVGNVDQIPPNCAQLRSLIAPTNATLNTTDTRVVFYVIFWSTTNAPGYQATAKVNWNISRYAQPPLAKNAGPVCRRTGERGSSETGVCSIRYTGYGDGFDRRVMIAEIGRINRTDLRLLVQCRAHISHYLIFFLFLPALLWGFTAAILFGYEHYKKHRERLRTDSDASEDGDYELSTEFRPSRSLRSSLANPPTDESSLLLRSLPTYDANSPRR